MGRNKDFMTALLMARKALSKGVAGLSRRLDDVRCEVALLRQEVADVRQLTAVGAEPLGSTELPETREPADSAGPADSADPTGATQPEWPDPDLADTGQEPPFPPLTDDDDDDEADVGADTDADREGAFIEKIDATPGRHETQEDVDHGVLLLKAAQTGPVALICHREVWEFLAACAAGEEHFCFAYELTDEGDGRVRAMLSGRSVIGALTALRRTRDASHLDGTWALASVLYSRIAETLRATARDGKRPPAVLLDDGVGD
ncbi:hypothetical protein [Streptomyces chrestomyceticus]|uniref:hypothetical protein n=1 Tax=Streptomyces chrestomyceticus TaxID=68185 RepID=UPI0037B92EDD